MSNNIEIIEAEEVKKELPLDKEIENTLVKHNVTDAIINALKEKYGGLKLRSIDDQETYLEIVEARKEVRKWGILTEKLTKKGREDAVATQKKWLAKEKEIMKKIGEVQDPLDAEIDRYDKEKDRKDAEEAKRKEDAYMQRQATLVKMGAVYSDMHYILGDVAFEVNLIKEADDEIWNISILPKYQVVYNKNESDRLKKEQERIEIEERTKREREEFEEQQRVFKQQREEFNRQQEEVARKLREDQDRLDREANEKRQSVIRQRCNQLQELGMKFSFQYDAYIFEDVNVDNKTEICLYNESEWDDLIKKITHVIADRKEILEHFENEKRMKAEQERFEEQKRNDELKKQQEEQRRIEELDKSNDRIKYDNILLQISHLKIHEMKSPYYRRKVAIIKEKIEEINNL